MILAEEPLLVGGVTGVRVLLWCYCCYQDIKTLLMAVITWLTFPVFKWENVWELPERSCGRTPVPRWEPLNTTQCHHHQSGIFSCTIHTLHHHYTTTTHNTSYKLSVKSLCQCRLPKVSIVWTSTKTASSIKGGGSIPVEIWAASELSHFVFWLMQVELDKPGHWTWLVPGTIIIQPLNIMLSVVMKCCASGPRLGCTDPHDLPAIHLGSYNPLDSHCPVPTFLKSVK